MGTSDDRILQLAEKVRQYKTEGIGKSLSEQDTKALLVEPLLEIAGWDVGDPTQVSREDRPTERPVDYSLKLRGKAKVLVECKRLRNRLDRRKDLEQALAYAAAAGVRWCVLTNGALVRIYNSLAPEVASKKLLQQLDLATVGTTDGLPTERAVEILRLISPSSVDSGEIDRQWDRRYTGSKIRQTVETLLSEPDSDFVNLVKRRMKQRGQTLSKKETSKWLKTLDIKVRTRPTKFAPTVPGKPTKVVSAPAKMRIGADTFEIRYSYEILTNTAEWLVTKGKLSSSNCPVPIGRARNLVNTKPTHRSGTDFKAPKQLSNGLWVEANHSTKGCIGFARLLLERFGHRGEMLEVQ